MIQALVIGLLLPATIIKAQIGSYCKTPNNEDATCISIYECPPLLNLVRVRTSETLMFLRASQCGYDQDPLVCCGRTSSYTKPTTPIIPVTKPTYTNSDKMKLLPQKGQCGAQLSGRIFNGEACKLDEFPWMAMLQYKMNGKMTGFNCGGTLINNRYVLTAAHCVAGRIRQVVGELASIRLGEYDTTTNPDCETPDDCADRVQDIPVEEAAAHEKYSDSTSGKQYDIAYARLSRAVVFSDYIKPICLPFGGERSSARDKLFVCGWGLTEKNIYSTIKLKLAIPIFDQQKCQEIYFNKFRVSLDDSQMCAGGEFNRDSCQGDSGGPLMRTFQTDPAFWYIEGIVSFGARCGTKDIPGIYTRVIEYIPWILDKIRP